MIYAVIMAGGGGTRFWPLSRISKPKQFLNLFGDQTMLQKTVGRLKGVIEPENVMVITNDDYLGHVKEQLPALKESYIIGETIGRNTAPCVAAAAAFLYKEHPDAVMAVLPADHEISNEKEFIKVIKSAAQCAERDHALVTIGIEPDRPETGYGYIRREVKSTSVYSGKKLYDVRNFTEKPDLEKAEEFLSSGDYLWNSGIFIWKVKTIIEAFEKHLPEIHEKIEILSGSVCNKEDIDRFYHSCPSISIDYGIMEKAGNVKVIPGNFGWNDVGSWKAVYDLSAKDKYDNARGSGRAVLHKSSSNLIHSRSGKLVTLVGVDNIGLIETDDTILVINLDQAQEVKELYEKLKKNPENNKFL